MRKCFLCKTKNRLIEFNNKYICEECYIKCDLYEASLVAFNEWMISVKEFLNCDYKIDIIIKEILYEVKKENDIEKQKKMLVRKIEEIIYKKLKYYNKDELYVAMLTIKESIRRLLLRYEDNLEWEFINDTTTITILMSIIRNIKDDEYENNLIGDFEYGYSNLIIAICMARRYSIIIDNIQLTMGKDLSIDEICFELIEIEEMNEYFDRYLKNGIDEKPEDYKINNTILKKKLEEEGKTPEFILKNLQDMIKNEFGFESKSYKNITEYFFKKEFPTEEIYYKYIKVYRSLFEDCPLIIIKKNFLEKLCVKGQLEFILDTFSINRNINKHEFNKELELLSFYEKSEFIIFGNIDFIQNISAFEKFLLSGDYIDVFKKNISKNKVFTKIQKKMSQYLSASVADYLYINGYKLPMEKYKNTLIPRFEIDKIKISGKQLLSTCGDIDVLALDTSEKTILLFELKYYKPAISAYDVLYKDKSRIERDEVIRKMKKREEVISKNINEVVKFILGKYEDGYKVKSILLTPRTNYYAIKEEEINYLTWVEFKEKVKNNQL
ncbi:MAG: hypothetical protein E7J22_00060 [Clostridium perfringens]|nr:hypothetical protein [Clostridium perfringens]MDU7956177.1 hypothetical protein [Clostridium perfringens]MDU7962718.1 hypothetical protein [Clostridium perfringens]HEE9817674.1 hypothetical protein [Clostridium perfringens]HEO1700786.1 hypothetical protein [Clostridium perfringens]